MLGDYASVARVSKDKTSLPLHQAIEYRDIPKGNYLTFNLENLLSREKSKYPTVGEGDLLFGTMRAYLGNVLVTPKSKWLGLDTPLAFSVKAEFVHIAPFDKLTYFWWAYLRSPLLLELLPVGSGGTRPRLQPEALLRTPLQIPDLSARTEIHSTLENYAREEWRYYILKKQLLEDMYSS